MVTKRSYSYFIPIIKISFVIVFGYLIFYIDKIKFNNCNRFNQAAINGKIKEIEQRDHGFCFRVKLTNNPYEFDFYPTPDKNGIKFIDVASIGAKILKPAHSDTLTLIQNQLAYKFTFVRVDP